MEREYEEVGPRRAEGPRADPQPHALGAPGQDQDEMLAEMHREHGNSYVLKVIASSLNVRSTPDTKSGGNIIGSLPRGAEVTATGEAGVWKSIQHPRGKAFVHGDFVAPVEKAPRHDEEPAPNPAPHEQQQQQHQEPPPASGFDWTTYIGKKANAPIGPDVAAKMQGIAAGRPARLSAALGDMGSRLDKKQWMKYGNQHGWGYAGNAKKEADVPTTGDKILDATLTELFTGESIEAHASAVVTYDGTLSIGSGWANQMAAEYVHRWLLTDSDARARLLDLGFAVTGDGRFAVIDDAGQLVVGDGATKFLRDQVHGPLLDVLSGLIERPESQEKAMNAQVSLVKSTIVDKLRANGLYNTMLTWPVNAVRLAVHLNNWLPAGGPCYNPKDYTASHGTPDGMLRAFAKNLKFTHKANGACILGDDGMTALPVEHVTRWGEGYAKAALGHRTEPLSFAEARSSGDLAGHVLIAPEGVWPNTAGKHRFYDLGTY